MAIIPRRHRSLICKLLVIIPVAWLTIAFLLYSDHHNSENGGQAAQGQPLASNDLGQPGGSGLGGAANSHKSKGILGVNEEK